MPSVCHKRRACAVFFVTSAGAVCYEGTAHASFRTARTRWSPRGRPKRHAPPVSAQGVRVGAELVGPAADPGGRVRSTRRVRSMRTAPQGAHAAWINDGGMWVRDSRGQDSVQAVATDRMGSLVDAAKRSDATAMRRNSNAPSTGFPLIPSPPKRTGRCAPSDGMSLTRSHGEASAPWELTRSDADWLRAGRVTAPARWGCLRRTRA